MYNSKEYKCDNESLMKEIIEVFLSEKPKKTVWGNFRIEGSELIYKSEYKREIPNRSYNTRGKDEYFKKYKQLLEKINSGALKFYKERHTLDEINEQYKKHLSDKNKYFLYNFSWYEAEIEVIAKKLKGNIFLGNSSILRNIGRYASYGHDNPNRTETTIQRLMQSSGKFIMVPFNAFKEANLNITKFKIIERANPENVVVKVANREYNEYNESRKKLPKFIDENRHYTGASLFEVDGKCFLFDVDREELKHKIFNAFVVQLPVKVKSIADAYKALKPQAVLDAEKKGLKIVRQGEFFYIPCTTPKEAVLSLSEKEAMLAIIGSDRLFHRSEEILKTILGKQLDKILKESEKVFNKLPKRVELKAGNNRPNHAELGIITKDASYVKGKIEHSGREHRDVKLETWHKVVPNTAVKSFTITGDID